MFQLFIRIFKFLQVGLVCCVFMITSYNSISQILPGANKTDSYIQLLKEKNVAIVANQTSLIEKKHLVDSLISSGISVKKIFCPEHGFRGVADAGEEINSTTDKKTGLPIISLYGKNKKPSPEQLKEIDYMVFDLQDVGVRFYTYISTLHYVMEACAENNVILIVLDRPNPNSHYIDGPLLKMKFKSFVGMHPVPLVYGMTIGEYAQMINGEGWLSNGMKCKLQIIKIENYSHQSTYSLPVKPSPNLPNQRSIYLYPSLGFFEGTNVSVGRGTDFPFQVIGNPEIDSTKFMFIPKSKSGAKNPPFENKRCYGFDLRESKDTVFTLKYVIELYNLSKEKESFFNSFFNKLAGNDELIQQIKAGKTEKEIRESWQSDINNFKEIRKKYLLYE